ncbi:MAG: flagellar hook capping FlgD N-terminal domain-containing protein [Pseudomonadota bacterium]
MATAFDTTLAGLGIKRTQTGPTIEAANSAVATGTLGQQDFLKLMTAQLKNQDPFDPVDNTQMVAQMAQFSSLAGISEMNTTLKAIAGKLGSTSTTDAVSYIGKTVLTEGGVAYGRSTGGIAGAVELDKDTTSTIVSIAGANGETLRTFDLGAQKAGTVEFDWDGLTAAGADAGTGPFTVSVQARQDATTVAARTLVWAPVAAVAVPVSGPAQLTIPGLGQIPVTAVRKIG